MTVRPIKRALVTGGAGFIGGNLVHRLIANGCEVLNVDKLTYAGNTSSISDLMGNPLHRLLVADIVDQNAIQTAIEDFRPDCVMHLAAESHVDRSIDGPGEFMHTNVMGTFSLLQASLAYFESLSGEQRQNFRFLHVSTDEVFGSLTKTGFFTEESSYRPRSPYSASKASSDHLVRAWNATYGLPTLVTNCSNNYGPFQFPEKLIPVVILRCLRGEAIPVYGDGSNVRDWLHVEDHCDALIDVAERGRLGETYAIGGDNELSNLNIVRLLCGALDRLKPAGNQSPYSDLIQFVEDRPGHDFRYAVDASKIRNELGWKPRWNGQHGLEETVRWYLANENWWQQILSGEYRTGRLGNRKGAMKSDA